MINSIYPILEEIKAGWAARGNGWAVHAKTKEEAINKYHEREKYYEWLDQQPIVHKEKENSFPNVNQTTN